MNAPPPSPAAAHAEAAAPAIEAHGLSAGCGGRDVLQDVSPTLRRGEILCLIGHDGAGKSTLLHALFGLHGPSAGAIPVFGETPPRHAPAALGAAGVALVPEERGVFPDLTVEEIFGLALRAVRARDAATGAPAEHGELEFRGPSMFHCYLGDGAATARAMTEDGFFRSGDLGRVHPDGRGFDFETRMDDALRLGGFLVNPEEIEAYLKHLPGVREAQVVGAAGGTVAVGFVQPEAGARLEEPALAEACRRDLARFKVPARIVPIEAFPVTESANGMKIRRVTLREMAEAVKEG